MERSSRGPVNNLEQPEKNKRKDPLSKRKCRMSFAKNLFTLKANIQENIERHKIKLMKRL